MKLNKFLYSGFTVTPNIVAASLWCICGSVWASFAEYTVNGTAPQDVNEKFVFPNLCSHYFYLCSFRIRWVATRVGSAAAGTGVVHGTSMGRQ
jgi:hypothetical protein